MYFASIIQSFLNKYLFKVVSYTLLIVVHLHFVGEDYLRWWSKVCVWLRAWYEETLIMHFIYNFIYNTQHFLYPWNEWPIKNKILPSRQYTLCLYVHIMQYVEFSHTMPWSIYCMYLCIRSWLQWSQNASCLFLTLAFLVYWQLSNRPHLLPLMTLQISPNV